MKWGDLQITACATYQKGHYIIGTGVAQAPEELGHCSGERAGLGYYPFLHVVSQNHYQQERDGIREGFGNTVLKTLGGFHHLNRGCLKLYSL